MFRINSDYVLVLDTLHIQHNLCQGYMKSMVKVHSEHPIPFVLQTEVSKHPHRAIIIRDFRLYVRFVDPKTCFFFKEGLEDDTNYQL